MPIRINLKELFGSDPQSVTVDKINFNFNKLLELGIGLPGAKGLTGPQGAAGPQGLAGPQGTRGTLWFIGTGDPNPQTFTGLMDGDFYLDTTNSEIWQYSEGSGSWTLLIDFGSIVNNYLLTSGVAFIRGLGETSPDDERFIVFPFRGNDSTAQVSDVLGGSSQNDILFLNNFNEKFNVVDIDNFPTSTNDLYTAIQKIFTDSTSGVPGRYHLELGSLFADSNGPNINLLSSLKHNLKVRHTVDDLGGSPTYASSNSYLYIGRISLSKTEVQSSSELDYNSVFEFITSKYNNEGTSAINRELTVRFGSAEGIGEYITGALADGININLSNSEGSMEIGIAREFSSNNTDVDGNNYALIGYDSNVSGLMLNGDVYQEKGNIVQLGSSGSEEISSNTSTGATVTGILRRGSCHNLGIAIIGNRLYTASGVSPLINRDNLSTSKESLNESALRGHLAQWNIQNETPFLNIVTDKNGQTGLSLFDPNANQNYPFSGAGICDIVVNGQYMYIIGNQINGSLTELVSFGNQYRQSNLGIIKHDFNGQIPNRIYGNVPYSSGLGLDGAWRAKLTGGHLVVAGNKLRDYGSPSTDLGQTLGTNIPLSFVNVTDPQYPFVDSSISIPDTHVLDLLIYENWLITLVLVFQGVTIVPGNPRTATGYQVKLQIRNITSNSNGKSVTLTPDDENILYSYSGTINYSTFFNEGVVYKTGSLSTDGKYIYASYIDKIHVANLDDYNSTTGAIGVVEQFTYTSATYPKAYDSKIAGQSLYLLHGGAAAGGVFDKQYNSANTYLSKVDISDPLNPYIQWTQEVDGAGTRFEISGNKAYVAHQNKYVTGSPRPGVTTIELNGIKSDHVELGRVRASHIQTTMDIESGGSAKINGDLNVGASAMFDKSVDIGDQLRLHSNYTDNVIEIYGQGKLRTKIGTTSMVLQNTSEVPQIELGYAATYATLEFTNGGYFLSSTADDNLLFGALSGGSNFELVVVNANNTLLSPLTAYNGVQVTNALWVGGKIHTNADLSTIGTVSVGTVTGTGAALYRNASTGVLATTSSDERLKQNIEKIEGALDKVLNMRGVYFNWKDADDFSADDNSRQIGMIAQEVEEILPEAVILNGVRDYKTIRYSEMISVLVEAIKEQQEQIEIMKDEIAVLKGTSPEGY
jgi:hypothetical protein